MNWWNRSYAHFYQNVLFPLFEIKVPPEGKIRPHWKQLLHTQFLTREELERLQMQKLKQLLQFAYRESPYYRQVMDRRGLNPGQFTGLEWLRQMPIIDKQTIRENLEAISTQAYRGKRVQYNTGGSTGVPMQFYLPRHVEKSRAAAAALRGYGWWGYRPGLPMAYFWSSPIDTAREVSLKQRMYRFFAREHYFDAYRISESLLNEMVFLMRHRPGVFLKGYPSSLTILARFIVEHQLTVPSPGAVFTTGETLFPEQRELMEQAFHTSVVDFYGNRETNAIIFQCPDSGLYHVNDEDVLVEVEPLKEQPNSRLGELIITDLVNYATPFIRYRTGDLVELGGETCTCGRGLHTIRKIVGRTNQMLRLKNGRLIIPSIFPHYFKDLPGVQQFRVVQEDSAHIRLELVVPEGDKKKLEKKILSGLRPILGEGITLSIDYREEIPPLKSGKISYVLIKQNTP